jgi:hypothetical protein
MRRELDHVVRSQRVMLDRLGQTLEQSDDDARIALAEHCVDVESWLETAGHVRHLGVSYERVLADPLHEAARIASFLGVGLDVAAMARAVEPALRRQI